MARRRRVALLPPAGGRVPSVKAGGVRVSKKHEAVPAGRNTRPPGKDKTSMVSISRIHHVDVMLRKTRPHCRMEGRGSLQEEREAVS
ncbi:death-associated protein-like 1 isoform X2 [Numida meleagris]|uniref:death-associated protein-like 1 isoform X2 n=1 Tax=Numida meleagris TaxID=8996 RepID=UPI000B3DD215|nr:death-associated protein-like 1 isoform X2 [Numida meleagris]